MSSATNIKEEESELISGFIILKLVDKHCISTEEEDHNHGTDTDHDHDKNSTLPKASFFIGELFEEFGTIVVANNNSEISHEGFEKIYEKLKLGSHNDSSKSTTDTGGDHSGHDHRRRKRRSTHDEHHDEHKKVCSNSENSF